VHEDAAPKMMRRPEQERVLERRPDRLGEAELGLYDILVQENKNRAINVEDFSGHYGAGAVRLDRVMVAKLEEKFLEEEKKDLSLRPRRMRGELFEAVVNDGIENNDWFGGDATIIVPSRYDDIVNKVDSIVEFEEAAGNSYLALAIDVTKNEKEMWDKFAAIRDSIKDGRLSRVKYFQTEGFRGELKQLPRVVMEADDATFMSAVEDILKSKRLKNEIARLRGAGEKGANLKSALERFAELRTKIATHPIQFKLLLEIRSQLLAFSEYAGSSGKRDSAVAYDKVLRIINRVIEEKSSGQNLDKLSEGWQNDRVLQMILGRARNFGKDH
jgi:hypothetical protein